jgi:hypothetical protein
MLPTRGQPHLVFVALDPEKRVQPMSQQQMSDLSSEMMSELEKISWIKTENGIMELVSERLDDIEFSYDVQIPDFETIMEDLEASDMAFAKKVTQFLDSIYEMVGDLYYSDKVSTLMHDICSGSCSMDQIDVLERVEDITSIVSNMASVLEKSFMQVLEKYLILVYKEVLHEESVFNEQNFWDSMRVGVDACNNVRVKWNEAKNAS